MTAARRIVTAGLYPSESLYPSNTLYPSDVVYAGGPISPHQIWLQTSPANITDVSAYVEFGDGITYTYGRQTQFDDAAPGTFTFTLNNTDGRFTPDNPTSPYTLTVAEGSLVKWVLGTRIISGHILSIEIPSSEDKWDQIVITCDDMLGTAARHQITSIPDALLQYAKVGAVWKLDDNGSTQYGKETVGDPLGVFSVSGWNNGVDPVTFGVQQAEGLPGTAATITASPGNTVWFGTRHGNTVLNTNITTAYLGAGTAGQVVPVGSWNMWVYPGSTVNFAVIPAFAVSTSGVSWSAQVQCTPGSYTIKPGAASGSVYNLTAAQQQQPHYLEMQFQRVWQSSGSYWAFFTQVFMDGTSIGSVPWYDPQHGYQVPASLNALSPVEVNVSVTTPAGASAPLSGTVQRISYTGNGGGREYQALWTSLDGRRSTVDQIAEDVQTAVYNGPLSAAPVGHPDVAGASVLDVLNEIARTESGYLFAQTTGTVQTSYTFVQVRARDRPSTVKAAFDVTTELDGPPAFVRDITNVAAQVDVAGPAQTVTVSDPTVTGRYVTAGTSETVLLASSTDLLLWGQDRLNRGKNRAVRAQTFTVDTVTTPTDRAADLLALLPGDRVRLTNTPAARLGFSSWDGWVLGGAETHTFDGNRFTFTLTPTLPATAVYDTALYAAGGDLTLGNTYTASATSIVFNSSTPVSTAVPYTVLIDREQLTVTAISGSTWTVTRGANGTTPASHTVNAVIEIVPTALYAY